MAQDKRHGGIRRHIDGLAAAARNSAQDLVWRRALDHLACQLFLRDRARGDELVENRRHEGVCHKHTGAARDCAAQLLAHVCLDGAPIVFRRGATLQQLVAQHAPLGQAAAHGQLLVRVVLFQQLADGGEGKCPLAMNFRVAHREQQRRLCGLARDLLAHRFFADAFAAAAWHALVRAL